MNENNGEIDYLSGRIMVGSSSASRSLPVSSSPSASVGVGVNGGVNYILHPVSKFDTLAGVAIKYGVEVADIKKLNGLVTDLQMFALKTLQIPLPGRHPPSPSLSSGHETPQRPSSSENMSSIRRHSDLFDSFQSLKLKSSSERKVSSAMSTLQGYYGLRPSDQKVAAEGFEMAVYRKGGAHYLEDGPLGSSSPGLNPPLSHHRKSKSVANGFSSENGDLIDPLLSQESDNSDSDRWIEKLLRRRQKSEADFTSRTPEKLLKEENSGSSTISAITGKESDNSDSDRWIEKLLRRRQKSEADFTSRTPEKLLKEENSGSSTISAITGKGLALRPKSASRTTSGGVDSEASGLNPIPVGLGDSLLNDSVNGVRKSSSTSSLQDSDNGALSSIWPTSKWNLKPDFQALSTAAITRPIFDGLPKPMGRRNKTALD